MIQFKKDNEDSRHLTDASILIVEDEVIVSMNIQEHLTGLGYKVAGTAASGEDALKKALDLRPDLILMDIVLQGTMDGIDTAQKIHIQMDVPIVYLTAYSDSKTLARAKVTEPYGYILKPFDQRELMINIEIALYKHKTEKRLLESRQWLLGTIKAMGCAVIATDKDGTVTFINDGAQALTGWGISEATGQKMDVVFNVAPETPVKSALKEGVFIARNSIMTNRNGSDVPINYSSMAINDESGHALGTLTVIHTLDTGQ